MEKDWYEEHIEEGIRTVVKLLRGNGINTTYSCHHAMVIEAENYENREIETIYDLLIENGYDGFKIEMVFYKERDKNLSRSLRLKFYKCPVC